MNANEPVAWMELYKGKPNQLYWEWDDCKNKGYWTSVPLYTNPVKELTNEVYFCSRCGKRLGDGIHTCTPPADILRKAQEK